MAQIDDIVKSYKEVLRKAIDEQKFLKESLDMRMRKVSLEDRKKEIKNYNDAVDTINANIRRLEKELKND